MKALSIQQPWAYMIACGEKDIENRTWATSYRGPVLIHASLKPDREAMSEFLDIMNEDNSDAAFSERDLDFGAIIGVAHIVDCVTESDSEWFDGPFGFVLRDAELFDDPVPAKGKLGLWEVAWTR